MRGLRTVLVGVLLQTALSGCFLVERWVGPSGPEGPAAPPTGTTPAPGDPVMRPGDQLKEVVAKEAPATLVARDGTVCRVSADRFERVEVGDRILCMWSARNGRRPPSIHRVGAAPVGISGGT